MDKKNKPILIQILTNQYFFIVVLIIAGMLIGFIIVKSYQLSKTHQPTPLVQPDIEELLAIVETDPTAVNYINLGLAYTREKKYEKAIEATQLSILFDPNDPNDAIAYNNIGVSYNELKQWDKAIEALNRALELNPGFNLARNNLQVALDGKSSGKTVPQ